MIQWTWNKRKAAGNRAKHGVSFTTAAMVFDDPLQLSQPDPHPDADRWQTLGQVGGIVLFVVHSWPDEDGIAARIISARKATSHERRSYEERN